MQAATDLQLADLLERFPTLATTSGRTEWLEQLISVYETLPTEAAEERHQARLAFLRAVQDVPAGALSLPVVHFLVSKVEPDDFSHLEWDSPDAVLDFCEILSASNELEGGTEARASEQIRPLLRHALEWLESRNKIEQMFQVLQLAPIAAMQYPELRRMRNRAYVYEKRRVQRVRRFIYGWLVLHLVSVLVIFPVLFVNAENGAIQREIEQATDLQADEEPHQFLTLPDALYWSLITAGGIGYGDLTPVTGLGRALAAALGGMGVITIGVIAGLILEWISPRSLD